MDCTRFCRFVRECLGFGHEAISWVHTALAKHHYWGGHVGQVWPSCVGDAGSAAGNSLYNLDRHRALGAFVVGIMVFGKAMTAMRLLAAGLIVSGLV